jgi:hypothetical protein
VSSNGLTIVTLQQPEAAPAGRSEVLDQLNGSLMALEQAEVRAQPAEMAEILRDLARCHLALRMPDAATWYLQRALGWSRLVAGPCSTIEVLCELAEAHLSRAVASHEVDDSDERRACLERARDHAFEAATLARRTSDAPCEVRTLLHASRILQRCGDEGDASTLRAAAERVSTKETAEFLSWA